MRLLLLCACALVLSSCKPATKTRKNDTTFKAAQSTSLTENPTTEIEHSEEPEVQVGENQEDTTTDNSPSENLLTAEDVRAETEEAIQTAKQFAEQRERELHKTIDSQYQEFMAKLDLLKEEASSMREQAKTRVTNQLAKINDGMVKSAEKLAKAEDKSQETLNNLSQELQTMLAKFNNNSVSIEIVDSNEEVEATAAN